MIEPKKYSELINKYAAFKREINELTEKQRQTKKGKEAIRKLSLIHDRIKILQEEVRTCTIKKGY
ncbi:MAG: hypothetical protein Unbinned5350contig1001_58 [Prokaryotic dsDNA virus sp.]|nr:MAG: hypothetical protein Unbinned5350contig1001_58 [Prokaryotic dsDNA virus sp.]|tara:strand:- start:42053 stop:42247 length:195 start_codon:yes stop_codon:yes gene_type:complete